MIRRPIPGALLSTCAAIAARRETHATLDNLFTYAGAVGEPPTGSKDAKALAWLRATNRDNAIDPLGVIGRIIENYMEEPLDALSDYNGEKIQDRERLSKVIAQCDLQYVKGGKLASALGAPSRTLEQYIRENDLQSIDLEFNRALSNVENDPREAVSAASNILESICKIYIEEEHLDPPAKLDLRPVWTIVRKHLKFDPSLVEDQDLQQILSGLISIVDGISALRTHASSAHGAGKKAYRVEPRHARLSVHAAHTVALFILESWKRR
jgi:hypothetical protein